MNDQIFEEISEEPKNLTEDLNNTIEYKNNNKKSNKNIIIIISIVVVLLIAIILICVLFFNNKADSKNKDNDIVTKESVSIAGKEYIIFDTTELILDVTSLSTNDIINISKLENLEKLDIKNVTLDDISFIKNLKKLNVLKINVSTKVVDFTSLSALDNLFTLEIYGGIGKSADMTIFNDLDKVSTLYLTLTLDRDISFIKEMGGLSLLSIDCSVDLYHQLISMLENTKVRLETHGNLSKTDTSNSNAIDDGIINWSQYDFNSTEVISIALDSKYNDIKLLQSELDKLSNYTNLKSLTISTDEYSDPFSVENFDFLKNLTKLETLHIDYLNANDISAIGNLSNLKTLVLSNGNMANAKFSSLSKLVNLESLNLSMQNITDISFLSKLTNLKALYLSGNNFASVEPLKNLTKLTELYIGCNTSLSNYSIISYLTNLETLMITLDTIDITIFSNLKNLKNLYVGISFDKLDEFKATYPSITIEPISECV